MPISSPPADYDLSKPGTSGVPVGPEVAILNISTLESLPFNEEGPICVRGEPCFRGYGFLANDPTAAKPECFLKDSSWFDTGDLGYLDKDGYLYITGRSKEVINRGGEIIPPMEVEEAIMSHPDIAACAAFSAAHDVLQETVGIVVCLKNDDIRRLDLPTLHAFIAHKLAAPKWPQCLVFMAGGLPKSHTNKLLRVKLGTRLGLPELNDEMSTWERTFEAQCPPQGTPLEDAIPSKPISVDAAEVQQSLRKALQTELIWICDSINRPGAVVSHVGVGVDRKQLIACAMDKLARYSVPTHVCVVEDLTPGEIEALNFLIPMPQDAVASILSSNESDSESAKDPVVGQVIEMFVNLLGLDYVPTPDSDFFHIGGSSMRASQLAGKVRKVFDVPCTGAEIFHHSTPKDLAEAIKHRQHGESKGGRTDNDPKVMEADRYDHGAPFCPIHTAPLSGIVSSVVQLVPMFIIFPVYQIARYLLFFTLLLSKSNYFLNASDREMVSFLIAYLMYHSLFMTFVPLIFVAIKWLVIGRYQAGRYPIRGSYYLRWWIVDVCRKVFPRGIWGWNAGLLRFYYRLLGADIAPGARISLECDLAEYDLIKCGRDCCVELSTVRGFGVDNGAMILGPVRIGHRSSVGIRSVVAPYTEVPDNMHLGPTTSSYDQTLGLSLNDKHARVNRMNFPQPSLFLQIFVGGPICFLVNAFSQIPPLCVLYMLLWFKSREGSDTFFAHWNELIDWLCDYRRIPFFVGIRLARALLSPFFYMIGAILVKKTVIGKFNAGPRNLGSDWECLRYWLAASLFTKKKLQKCTELMGRHYEGVSILHRMLGAKVGKRVFWPGSLPVTDGTFDLLELGDDCVFGSRSSILCTTIDHAERVILCAGANVSDNCVVMAGSVVGKNAVLGSNSICPEGMYLPSGSVWFGSNGCMPTCLDAGDAIDFAYYQPLNEGVRDTSYASATMDSLPMEGDESTVRPFGKAFYLGKAKGYIVLPLPMIIVFAIINRAAHVIFHLLPLMAAVQFGAVLLYTDSRLKALWRNSIFADKSDVYTDMYGVNHDKFLWWTRDFDNDGHYHQFIEVYLAILTCFIVTHFIRVIMWLVIELAAKWLIMGKRKPGRYNYDSSSYAQRWEIYQLVVKIRKLSRLNLLQFMAGTPMMNWYFRMSGGKVGKNCCLYPSGADPFMPEPDLVTIKDGCVIDNASLVCHLNTRGNFELQKIVVEENCTLRTRSRLQQGVLMERGSQLLEKSLAMTGETIDSRSVWQGGPASMWFRLKDEDLADYKPPSAPFPEVEIKRVV
jgi:carbonic anhydrase/acetyltransferase-like protein (isoleucine patch superfamily)/acyl carrier protein